MKIEAIAAASLAFMLAACGDDSGTRSESASAQTQQTKDQSTAKPATRKEDRLRPEMLVQFPVSAVACLTKEGLQKAIMHGINGETTKLNAMMIAPKNSHGECIMVDPKKRYKTLSVEYNVDDSDLGLVEIVGEGNQSDHGAWALTVGAVPAAKTN